MIGDPVGVVEMHNCCFCGGAVGDKEEAAVPGKRVGGGEFGGSGETDKDFRRVVDSESRRVGERVGVG